MSKTYRIDRELESLLFARRSDIPLPCALRFLSKCTLAADGHLKFSPENFRFKMPGIQIAITAARASWLIFRGDAEPEQIVNRLCHIENCFAPQCLVIGRKRDITAFPFRKVIFEMNEKYEK
jgi:hypothetical protein